MIKKVISAVLVSATLCPIPSKADNNCNCQKIVGRCDATVTLDKNRGLATLETGGQSCTRVIFGIDSTPYTSVFSGGRAVENVTIFDKSKSVSATIRSCDVCENLRDSGGPSDQNSTSGINLTGRWQSRAPSTVSMSITDNNGAISAAISGQTYTGSCNGSKQAGKLVLDCSISLRVVLNDGTPYNKNLQDHMIYSIGQRELIRTNGSTLAAFDRQ